MEVAALGGWLTGRLGFDPGQGVGLTDWLATPWQRLAEVTAGAVFHDAPGDLSRARAALSWYPRDVWVPGTEALAGHLAGALAATDWPGRERHMVQAYLTVAGAHNGLGLTEPLDPGTRPYYDRPFQVLDAGRFARALAAAIGDPAIRRLPPAGAADQFIDNTDALGDLRRVRYQIEICRSSG